MEPLVPGTQATHHEFADPFAKHRTALMFWRDGQRFENIARAEDGIVKSSRKRKKMLTSDLA